MNLRPNVKPPYVIYYTELETSKNYLIEISSLKYEIRKLETELFEMKKECAGVVSNADVVQLTEKNYIPDAVFDVAKCVNAV